MYEALEAIPNVIYTIGFLMTSVLRKKSDELLKATENQYETTRALAKQYMFFPHCADSWKKRSRNIVIKCEANSEGHASTWRMMLIKVAARVIVTTRRVRILIPKHWPYAK